MPSFKRLVLSAPLCLCAPTALAGLIPIYPATHDLCKRAKEGRAVISAIRSDGTPLFETVDDRYNLHKYYCVGAETWDLTGMKRPPCDFDPPTAALPEFSHRGKLCLLVVDQTNPFPADVAAQLSACTAWGIECEIVTAHKQSCEQYVVMGHGINQAGEHSIGPNRLLTQPLVGGLGGSLPVILDTCQSQGVYWPAEVLPLGGDGSQINRNRQLALTYCHRMVYGDLFSDVFASCMMNLIKDNGKCDSDWQMSTFVPFTPAPEPSGGTPEPSGGTPEPSGGMTTVALPEPSGTTTMTMPSTTMSSTTLTVPSTTMNSTTMSMPSSTMSMPSSTMSMPSSTMSMPSSTMSMPGSTTELAPPTTQTASTTLPPTSQHGDDTQPVGYSDESGVEDESVRGGIAK